MKRVFAGKTAAILMVSFLMGCTLVIPAGAEAASPVAAEVTAAGAELLTGQDFHARILELTQSAGIKAIKRSVSAPAAGVQTVLLSKDGELPVTAWFEEGSGTVFCYTEAPVLRLNENSSHMFEDFTGLTDLDVSFFDASSVTNMHRMFSGCSSLAALDLTPFVTSNVTDMAMMFTGCTALQNLNVSSFDTSSATLMYGMFDGCSSLAELDLKSFNTSNVTDMNWMFHNCAALTSLDLKSFDTTKVETMKNMFNGCKNLVNLNLASFNMTNVTATDNIFEGCTSLQTVKFKDMKLFELFAAK